MSARAADPVELLELLTIDVSAELRKLALGPLAGPWELPTQLVRWACSRAATRVELSFGRRSLEFVAGGTALDAADARRLAGVLDEGAPPQARHEALVALETVAGPNLLGLLALEARTLELRSGALRLSCRRGRSPSLTSEPATGDTRLSLTGLSLDNERARAELLGAARFARVPLRIDGQPAAHGFAGAWSEAELPAPLSGRVALVRGLRSSRLRVTVAGLVAAHLTVPGAPPFDAVVDADDWLPGGGGPAALREAVQPHVPAIVDAAVGLLLREARARRRQGPAEDQDLRHGLLTAARRRLRLGEVLRAPVVDAYGSAQAAASRLSLLELGQEAERRRGAAIEALEPGQAAADFVLRSAPWLRLDAESRSRLVELLGVRFVTPARREPASHWRRWRRRVAGVPAAVRRFWARQRRRRPLAAEECTPEERRLVDALRSAGAARHEALAFCLCAGGGAPFLMGSGPLELWLPRAAPLVQLAARAVTRDPGLGPAALAALSAASGLGFYGRQEASEVVRTRLET